MEFLRRTGEAEAGDAEQGEQESNDGGQNAGSAFELGEGLEELLSILIEDVEGDDRTEATLLPGRDGGAGDGETAVQRRGAGAHHMLAQTMVVGPPRAGCRWNDGDHARRIP
jgi:hypothetical protein